MKKLLLILITTLLVSCVYTRNTKDEFNKSASGTMVFARVSNHLALAVNAADMVYKIDMYMGATDQALKDSIRDYLLWEYRVEYNGGTFTLKGSEREWVIRTNGLPLERENHSWTIDYKNHYGELSSGVCVVRKSKTTPGGLNVAIDHDKQDYYYTDNSSTLEIAIVAPLEVLFNPNSEYMVEGSGQLIANTQELSGGKMDIDFRSESPLRCVVTSHVDDPYAGVALREGRLNCDVSGNYFKNDKVTLNVYNSGSSVYADINTNGVEVKKVNVSLASYPYMLY